MIVQKIFLSVPAIYKTSTIRFINENFFEVASFNTSFYGGHNYKRAPRWSAIYKTQQGLRICHVFRELLRQRRIQDFHGGGGARKIL